MVPNNQPGARCYQSVAVIGVNSCQHRSTAHSHPYTTASRDHIPQRFRLEGRSSHFPSERDWRWPVESVGGICVSSMIAHELSMGNGEITRISIILI